jgi:hypothetical protein
MRLAALLIYAVLLVTPMFAKGGGGRSFRGSHSGHSSASRSSSHAPSVSTVTRSRSVGAHTRSTKCVSCSRDSRGRIKRSPVSRADFRRQNPCPSTGRTSGICPGFVIDHRTALKRGGADEPAKPANMQWMSVVEAKAKDRVE